MRHWEMLCAAIDIGSNTTRVLVAEPEDGQLRKVMEQRAYTRIVKGAKKKDGSIAAGKIAEVADVVATQVRLAQELGAEAIRIVATAAVREAANCEEIAEEIELQAGFPVDVLSEHDEGRLAFIGATKGLSHPVDGEIGVVDVGGGSSEIILGTLDGGVREVRSFKIGSGSLAEEFIKSDPPGPAEIRKLRDRIEDFFDGVEIDQPEQAVAVGGSATSLRRLVGAVLEYETLERAVRVLTSDSADRGRAQVRARRAPRGGPPLRRPPARGALTAPRPAAADRQGRPARGRDPRPAQRRLGGVRGGLAQSRCERVVGALVEEPEADLVDSWGGNRPGLAHGPDRDRRCEFHGISVNAGADRGERDRPHSVLRGHLEASPMT